jgi:hypothetical protein
MGGKEERVWKNRKEIWDKMCDMKESS